MSDRRAIVLAASTSLFKYSAPDLVMELDKAPPTGSIRHREMSAFAAIIRKTTPPRQRAPRDPFYRFEENVRGLVVNPTRHCFSYQADRSNAHDPLLSVQGALNAIAGAIKSACIFDTPQGDYDDYDVEDNGLSAFPPEDVPSDQRRVATYLLDAPSIISGLQRCNDIGERLAPADIRRKLILGSAWFVTAHLERFYPKIMAAGSERNLHVVLDNALPHQFQYKYFDRSIADPLGLEIANPADSDGD